jgi:hypothetical protein
MPIDQAEILKRTEAARVAIQAAYGTEDDEYGATLFVSHHLAELDPSYWEANFQTASPEPQLILDSLVLRTDLEDEDDIDSLDFSLPGEVTDYVLCVSFNDAGEVEDLSMES